MDTEEFRRRGKEMVDFVANYLERDVKNYPARHNVQPGYLKDLLPKVMYSITLTLLRIHPTYKNKYITRWRIIAFPLDKQLFWTPLFL